MRETGEDLIEEDASLQNAYSALVKSLNELDLFPMLYDVILATSSQRTDLEKFYQLHKTYVTDSHADVDINLRNSLGPERFCKFYYRMVEKKKRMEERLLNACSSTVSQLTARLTAWCRRMIGECGLLARMKVCCSHNHTAEGEEEGEGCPAKLKALFNWMVERKQILPSK